ncbi:ImmA/IrrE family metallo-endopeptidase [Leifsonia sp. Leaf264]|uniref:ImmA/IrrE family metallo-endopeptidase n=1 Tax=Leifsonia sp. Leaf264 TaxID=1736314 RepID=UPI0012FBA94B|nr:ImmA/IrrE family metallo-endopeptidase [Leifsonia sp. Leaf264]
MDTPESHARLFDQVDGISRAQDILHNLAARAADHSVDMRGHDDPITAAYKLGIEVAADTLSDELKRLWAAAGVMVTHEQLLTSLNHFDGIRLAARKFGADNNAYDESGSALLSHLLGNMGGVYTRDDGRWYLEVEEDGTFTVHIHTIQSNRRTRFDIARAIGHYCLHYLAVGGRTEKIPAVHDPDRIWTGKLMLPHGLKGRKTVQANVFAAALLMPVDPFTDAWQRTGGDIVKVAAQFDVSPKMADIQAQVLELTNTTEETV